MTSADRRPRSGALAAALLAAALFAPDLLDAQGVRGWVGTSVQMVEIRPLGVDTVGIDAVAPSGDGYLYNGHPISCYAAGLCTQYRMLPEDQVLAATQDVSLTAWGFGIQGLSFTTHLRGRARLGSELIWPRSDDEFDALLAYAQLVRGPVRLRAGRQEVRSGLGFPAFDGGSLVVTHRGIRVEAYGGRSLARGLREPANEALRGLEAFLHDDGAYLLGGALQARIWGTAFTGRYQREIFADRSGLVSERASLDFVTAFPKASLRGSLDYDLGFDHVGKSHLTLSVPLFDGGWLLELSGRRYTPYFDLSTIWGFFQPVSYNEAEARLGWSASRDLGVWASGGWRSYEDAEATEVIRPVTDSGWRANVGARWRLNRSWSFDGTYRLERGPGALLSSGDVRARFAASESLSLSATGTTFQQIEEFRVGDGRAYGAGLSFDWSLLGRAQLSGGASLMRHRDGGSVFNSPWNQSRAWSSLRIDVGSDPGLSARRRP